LDRRTFFLSKPVRVGSGRAARGDRHVQVKRRPAPRPSRVARGTSAPVCLTARSSPLAPSGLPDFDGAARRPFALIEPCDEWWRVGRARCRARAHTVRSARAARDAAARTRRPRARGECVVPRDASEISLAARQAWLVRLDAPEVTPAARHPRLVRLECFRGRARRTAGAAGAARCFRALARCTAPAAGAARCFRGLARRAAPAARAARGLRGLARDARSASRTAPDRGSASRFPRTH